MREKHGSTWLKYCGLRYFRLIGKLDFWTKCHRNQE